MSGLIDGLKNAGQNLFSRNDEIDTKGLPREVARYLRSIDRLPKNLHAHADAQTTEDEKLYLASEEFERFRKLFIRYSESEQRESLMCAAIDSVFPWLPSLAEKNCGIARIAMETLIESYGFNIDDVCNDVQGYGDRFDETGSANVLSFSAGEGKFLAFAFRRIGSDDLYFTSFYLPGKWALPDKALIFSGTPQQFLETVNANHPYLQGHAAEFVEKAKKMPSSQFPESWTDGMIKPFTALLFAKGFLPIRSIDPVEPFQSAPKL